MQACTQSGCQDADQDTCVSYQRKGTQVQHLPPAPSTQQPWLHHECRTLALSIAGISESTSKLRALTLTRSCSLPQTIIFLKSEVSVISPKKATPYPQFASRTDKNESREWPSNSPAYEKSQAETQSQSSGDNKIQEGIFSANKFILALSVWGKQLETQT